jgi:two-component system OmpR family sensor kinase
MGGDAMPSVLIVDDDPRLLKMFRRTLVYENLDVLTARDGLEALPMVAAHCPDLIILDWLMPKMDGLTFMQRLRDADNATMILMLTARDGETVLMVQVARSLTERDRTLQSLATTLGGAGLLTILLAFGAGWLLSGLTLRPIHRITQTAQTIGDERDFARRVAYTGPQDEVGQLANTFNQMLARLQDAYQKVEHSLEMQRRFVADVSHELRTPLTTLRGNLDLLGRTPPAPPEEQADILADMVSEGDRMIRLVNELLLLARADAGRRLSREPLTIQPVLEETVRQAHCLDANRKITLDGSPDIAAVADRDAFKQVMLVLLDNALKHSAGEIHVAAQRAGAQVEIRIKDCGQGIPPDKLGRVFDRFYRADGSSNGLGFGLGLPIAKALTEGMGGTIDFESELGSGSTVTLRFPARSQPSANS